MPVYSPPSDLDIKMRGNAGGANNNKIIIWSKIISPTSAMDFLIDYTEAGFSEITGISIIAQRDTTNAFDVPNVAIKSAPTNTGVRVNITQGSNSLVTVLSLSVLGGPAIIPAAPINTIKLYCRVEGL